MNPEIINLYIEQMLKEVTEGVKYRILLEAQLKYTEKLNADLAAKLKEAEAQIEKLNRKKIKEVNTSADNF
jgi:hypothetical protein